MGWMVREKREREHTNHRKLQKQVAYQILLKQLMVITFEWKTNCTANKIHITNDENENKTKKKR